MYDANVPFDWVWSIYDTEADVLHLSLGLVLRHWEEELVGTVVDDPSRLVSANQPI